MSDIRVLNPVSVHLLCHEGIIDSEHIDVLDSLGLKLLVVLNVGWDMRITGSGEGSGYTNLQWQLYFIDGWHDADQYTH